jgi:hypothetical protein
LASIESNEGAQKESCKDDDNNEDAEAWSEHDKEANGPATSRALVQVAVDHQYGEDYTTAMLVVDDPTGISDEINEKMVQQDHLVPEEEEDEVEYTFIGASVDDKWSWCKQKRVLSSNTLVALNREAGCYADLPKRMKSFAATESHGMPELSLGLAAFDQPKLLPKRDVVRDDSPFFPSDFEEDRMLSEELEEKLRDAVGENSLIPLLTPPQSPRREDEIEWPSNLVIDSALMNTVNELRTLSPASFQDMEEEEEQRPGTHDLDTSTLTPLLRSIHVGTT